MLTVIASYPLRAALILGAVFFAPASGHADEGTLLRSKPAVSAVRGSDSVFETDWEPTETAARAGLITNAEHGEDRLRQFFRFRTPSAPESTAPAEVMRRIRPALPSDDLTGTVWLNCSQRGAQPAFRILLPNETDPRSGRPLEFWLPGETYDSAGQWQKVTVSGSRKAVDRQLIKVRTELHRSDIHADQAVVIGLAVLTRPSATPLFTDISEERIQGWTPAYSDDTKPAAGSSATLQAVPLTVELQSIHIDGQPRFLTLMPDHGEAISQFQRFGIRAAWIADAGDQQRAAQFRMNRLAVLATPPHPTFDPADFRTVLEGLPPLDSTLPWTSAWYLGTRVSPDQLPHLIAWSSAVRSADRNLRRLQLADLSGAAGAASREMELLGQGRHVVAQDAPFGDVRNEMFRRRRSSGSLAVPWTWIQLETPPRLQAWRRKLGILSDVRTVEPEQILTQVACAISSGCRGVGYWKTAPLNRDDPWHRDAMNTLELIGLKLRLVEPFLATSRLDGHLLVRPEPARTGSASAGSAARPLLNRMLDSVSAAGEPDYQRTPSEPDAAVYSSQGSILIAVTAWDRISQWVPSNPRSRTGRLTVSGSETASAWILTETGLTGLDRRPVAGGLDIQVPLDDPLTFVLVTSSPELIRELESRIHQNSERAAQLWFELASSRVQRVEEISDGLQLSDADQTRFLPALRGAERALTEAADALKAQQPSNTAAAARRALHNARIVQQICWRSQWQPLGTPASSPYTMDFYSLPAHQRMMMQMQTTPPQTIPLPRQIRTATQSALPSWSFSARDADFQTDASVFPHPTDNSMTVRLTAWDTRSGPSLTESARADLTVVLTSPALPVRSMDIVEITGEVRRRASSRRIGRTALIFDSELGPDHGVKPPLRAEWMPFRMIREVADGSDFRVHLGLLNEDDVEFRGLRIHRFPATAIQPASGQRLVPR